MLDSTQDSKGEDPMKTDKNKDVDNKHDANTPDNPDAVDNNTEQDVEEDSTQIFASLTDDSGSDSDAGDAKSGEDEEAFEAAQNSDDKTDDDEDDDSEKDPDSETSKDADGKDEDKGGDKDDPDSETNGSEDAEKLQRDLKAQSGRVRGLNRALEEERQRTKKYQQELETLRDQSRKLQEQKPEEAGIIPEDELKALEEDFPESAKIARAYVGRALQEIAGQNVKMTDFLVSQNQRTEQDLTRNELQRLEERHPDYMDIVQDQRFNEWVSSQPRAVQQAVESESADDASFVLDLYKRDAGYAGKGEDPAPSTVTSTQTKTDGEPDTKPKPKKRDLSDHAELPNKGGSRVAQESDDPIAVFNQITSGG